MSYLEKVLLENRRGRWAYNQLRVIYNQQGQRWPYRDYGLMTSQQKEEFVELYEVLSYEA